jgi:hypothetical protein
MRNGKDSPVILDYAVQVPANTKFEKANMGRDTQTYNDGPVRSDDD